MSRKQKGMKFDGQDGGSCEVKSRWSLLPWKQLEQVAKVFTAGAIKYADGNWKHVEPRSRYVDALMRHFVSWTSGERFDKDFQDNHSIKVSHLACLICNALFLMWFDDNPEGEDETNN